MITSFSGSSAVIRKEGNGLYRQDSAHAVQVPTHADASEMAWQPVVRMVAFEDVSLRIYK